ncbi:hypothetical protein EVAR_54111_1 [Eumeta japonica]|uniref:Uncharacterized protein n=1 Tax=Eumeta variegata TaxID=151549 RepID=A0A4C1Z0E8_EUMVA|nr:hypothetical protein EVAR_54111_1 [Eumeta japonica]
METLMARGRNARRNNEALIKQRPLRGQRIESYANVRVSGVYRVSGTLRPAPGLVSAAPPAPVDLARLAPARLPRKGFYWANHLQGKLCCSSRRNFRGRHVLFIKLIQGRFWNTQTRTIGIVTELDEGGHQYEVRPRNAEVNLEDMTTGPLSLRSRDQHKPALKLPPRWPKAGGAEAMGTSDTDDLFPEARSEWLNLTTHWSFRRRSWSNPVPSGTKPMFLTAVPPLLLPLLLFGPLDLK